MPTIILACTAIECSNVYPVEHLIASNRYHGRERSYDTLFWIGTFIMLVLAVSLIVLAIFYQRNLHQYKLQESELLLKASLESEQVERARIASELHDGLQGDLNAVKNFLFLSV